MTSNVTLNDVAAAAGVAVSTASRALNGTDRISLKTREHVRATADRLGFRPNALAQSFANGRSQTIGVMTHRAANPLSRPVFVGLAAELGARSQAVLLCDAHTEDSRSATFMDTVAQLRARRIDGLVVVGDGTSYLTHSITAEFDVPVVYAFTATGDPADIVVTSDDVAVGKLAVQHLIDTGRRRIAHITADPGSLAARRREEGGQEALRAAGLEWAAPVRWGTWSEGWGERATASMLAAGEDFDAIFCANDHMANGAERALHAAGLRVPEDVALVGVDNWDRLMVDQRVQHLTTIDIGLEKIGALAGELLVENRTTPGTVFVAPQLVVAETT